MLHIPKKYTLNKGVYTMDNEIYKIFDNTNLLDKFKELELQFQGNICDIYNYTLYHNPKSLDESFTLSDISGLLSAYIRNLSFNNDELPCFNLEFVENSLDDYFYNKYYKNEINEQYLLFCVTEKSKKLFKRLLVIYDGDIYSVYAHISNIIYGHYGEYDSIGLESIMAHKYMLDNGYKLANECTNGCDFYYTKENAKKGSRL